MKRQFFCWNRVKKRKKRANGPKKRTIFQKKENELKKRKKEEKKEAWDPCKIDNVKKSTKFSVSQLNLNGKIVDEVLLK